MTEHPLWVLNLTALPDCNVYVFYCIDAEMVRLARVVFACWQNCWSLENDYVKLIVVADVGPRILHASVLDGFNLLYEEPENLLGKTGGDEFRMYGGHRFWIAPENARTTLPDNHSAHVDEHQSGVTVTTRVGDLRKQIDISLAPSAAEAQITHTVTNLSGAPTELAPWALTVFRAGGEAALPLPPPAPWEPKHLLPEATIALWSYTDLGARCWQMLPGSIRLDQRSVSSSGFGMQKIGLRNRMGWAAYRVEDVVFCKTAEWSEGTYPDFGCNLEIFANSEFLELETLGPLKTLGPNQSCSLVEHWRLKKDTRTDWYKHLDRS